jgi:hypothetical protein
MAAVTLPSADRALGRETVTASAESLYAYAHGAAKSPSSCPHTGTAGRECTLTEALGLAGAGDSVLLATSGKSAKYVGDFVIGTSGTSAAAPVTIGPAPGVRRPAINGDASGAVPCPTSTCDGSVFTIGTNVFARIDSVMILGGDGAEAQGGGGVADMGTLSLKGVTITGCSGQVGGGVAVGHGARLTVADSLFTHDQSTYFGGAINSGSVIATVRGSGTVTVTGSTFTDDSSQRGGAIDSGDGGTGTLTVTDSTFDGDSAAAHGGAIDTGDSGTGAATVTGSSFSGDHAVNGGAIDNADSSGTGTLTVTGSTFSRDSATDGGAIDNAERGQGTVTVRASTFYADKAARQGSAADSGDAAGTGTFQILNSTIDGNLGRPAIAQEGGALQVAGSILAGSMANCTGRIRDGGYNLISDRTSKCGFAAASDLIGVSPRLRPLRADGGPTAVMAPSSTSPVLEQIPNPAVATALAGQAAALCPAADQRGTEQYEAYGCAIGSVDPANAVPVVTSLSSSQGPAAGGTDLTIDGGHFAAGATVRFGTVTATDSTVVSAGQIDVTVPALPNSDSALTVNVTVTSRSGLSSPERTLAAYSYYTADWSAYLDGTAHASYNPAATSITAASIPNLQPIWQWTPPATTNSGGSSELASPIVSDGVIYVGLEDGYMYAVSEAT